MKEKGRVTDVVGDTATVIFERCARCDRCNLCTPRKDSRTVERQVPDTLGVGKDDNVIVETTRKGYAFYASLCFIVPILLTAIAIGVGMIFSPLTSLVLALIAVVIGYAVAIPLFLYLRKNRNMHVPRMLSVLDSADGSGSKIPS